MKKAICFLVAGLMILASCGKPKVKVKLTNQVDSVSYCIGLYFAKQAKGSEIESLNPQAVAMAFDQVFSKDSIKITDQEIQTKIQTYLMSLRTKAGEKNLKEGKAYLDKNKTKSGVTTLPSGLQYEVLKTGTGAKPDSSDVVSVNYTLTTTDGKQLETTIGREPAKFPVTGVIKGWTEALLKMNVGSKWRVVLPSEIAYGAQGSRGMKPNQVLIFEMELLTIEPKVKADPKAMDADHHAGMTGMGPKPSRRK